MKFAVNYSPLLAELVQAGQVSIEWYKCPAWPDLVAEAKKTLPAYIHFPLGIGMGQGSPMDAEIHAPADLDRFAALMEATGTPFINTHFIAPATIYPGLPIDSRTPKHVRRVLDGALRDLEPLVRRFGAEKVLVENIINEPGWLQISSLPEVITRVVEESGCGFLFDLSHARITADNLGMDPKEYIQGLPTQRIEEIHVTGLQELEGSLLELMRSIGDPYGLVANMAGRPIDHMPMTEEDWPWLEWTLEQVSAGRWKAPWVVSFEYGGVGRFWEELTKREVYLDQLPRMAGMVRAAAQQLEV
jgi:uncharacterized protein (UPF0276 family)